MVKNTKARDINSRLTVVPAAGLDIAVCFPRTYDPILQIRK